MKNNSIIEYLQYESVIEIGFIAINYFNKSVITKVKKKDQLILIEQRILKLLNENSFVDNNALQIIDKLRNINEKLDKLDYTQLNNFQIEKQISKKLKELEIDIYNFSVRNDRYFLFLC